MLISTYHEAAVAVAERDAVTTAELPTEVRGGRRSDSEIASELPGAVRREELACVFQPQVAADGRVIGAEALLRWHHPRLGSISPHRFIPIAERSACIDHLTRWVIEAALDAAGRWHGDHPTVRVSVNVSARSVGDLRLLRWIVDQLDARELPPSCLIVELTETAVMGRGPRVGRFLDGLHEEGIKVALDDFGTGYSSLSTLALLPVDQLKVDRSFTAQATTSPLHEEIVRAVCELGRRLDISTVAEGVEDATTVALLQAFGVTAFQGFYFSRPISEGALQAMLGSNGGRWPSAPEPRGLEARSNDDLRTVIALRRAQELLSREPLDLTCASLGLVDPAGARL